MSDEFDELLNTFEKPKEEVTPKQGKPLILFIDDDESMRRGLTSALSHKYKVLTAESGTKGVEILSKDVQCVILDVKMRELNGFSTYPKLKAKCPDVPIIFYTAFQSEHDLQEVINKYKPEGYEEKGKDISFLENLIENAVKKYKLILENEEYKKDLERKVEERTAQFKKQKDRAERLKGVAEDALEKQKKAEDEKIKVEKLATAGLLAKGIAHNQHNKLGKLLSYLGPIKWNIEDFKRVLDILQKKESDSSKEALIFVKQNDVYSSVIETLNTLESLKNSTKEVLHNIRLLKGYSKKDVDNFEYLKIENIIRKTLDLYKNDTKNVHLKTSFEKEDYRFKGDLEGIEHVIINLITNALEAMDGKKNRELKIRTKKIKGGKYLLMIKDNGCGMTQETLENAFDPHYTTKELEEGTHRGLGLYTVWSTIEAHGGEINIKSKPNEYTRFKIIFNTESSP